MIWSDNKLREWMELGGVTPAFQAHINPASLDLCLGTHYRLPTAHGWSDPHEIGADGLTLEPGAFVLCSTLEHINTPTNAAGFLYLKSSAGRAGLEHLHAGYIDPGFCGELTLELVNHWPYPVTLPVGKRLFQLVLEDCYPVARSYSVTGHYQGQTGPTVQWDEVRTDTQKYVR